MDRTSLGVRVVATLATMTPVPAEVLANRKQQGYPPEMSKNVLIRNVPDTVHTALVQRADAQGKSLQEYLLGVLHDITDKPTMAEVMESVRERLANHKGPVPTRDDIVATIRAHRDA